MDRLPRLLAQLVSWDGAASVAVYAAACEGSAEADACEASVRAVIAALPRRVAECTVVSLAFIAADDAADRVAEAPTACRPYPINCLRNLAMSQARTELVFLLDVDFELPSGLGTELRRRADYRPLLLSLRTSRTALVVPAFELRPAAKMPSTRRDLASQLASGDASLFHVRHFPKGHRATDLTRWLSCTRAYGVAYEEYFEPYVIVSRRHAPSYDERFVGYGMNKVSHLYNLAVDGTRFVVLPEHFAVAYEHPRSASWHAIFGRDAETASKREAKRRLARLYRDFKSELPPLPPHGGVKAAAIAHRTTMSAVEAAPLTGFCTRMSAVCGGGDWVPATPPEAPVVPRAMVRA